MAPLHLLLLPDVWVSTFFWSPGGGGIPCCLFQSNHLSAPDTKVHILQCVFSALSHLGLPGVLEVGTEVFLSQEAQKENGFRQVTLFAQNLRGDVSEVRLGPGSACFSLLFILDTSLSFRPETADEES